jgi:small subunit ribosomal protein S2
MNETVTRDLQGNVSGDIESRLKAALEAGLEWGRVRRMTHPKMQPFILTSKGEVEIIDLSKTLEALDKALEFIAELVSRGGIILLVGTQPAARSLIAEYGKKFGFPYVNERWLGGTLTNFKTFISRIQYLKDLEAKIASEEFAAYTKKERMKMQQEANELRKKFEGLREMTKLPDAVFIVGLSRHETALREAHRMHLPVIAICNTNDDPSKATYPIPGNDNSSQALAFILKEFESIWKNKKEIQTEKLENKT